MGDGNVNPLHLLNPKNYSKDEQMMIDRWRICRACPELDKTFRCKQCGCFMKAKVKLSEAFCPLQKWGKESE